MKCVEAERDDVFEEYLAGRLGAAEQEAFEDHYFSCADCFEKLQALRAVQTELAETPAPIQERAPAETPAWLRHGRWIAVAAMVLLAVGIYLWQRTPAPIVPLPPVAVTPKLPAPATAPKANVPSESSTPAKGEAAAPSPHLLAQLARFDPPAYIPPRLRGSTGEATERFVTAMQHYSRGDYQQAVQELREAARLDPQAPQIRFFLGISELLSNQSGAGIATLRETIALGPSPYFEEAHLYLAKGYLKEGDLVAAKEQLNRTIHLHGRLEDAARQLLKQLSDPTFRE